MQLRDRLANLKNVYNVQSAILRGSVSNFQSPGTFFKKVKCAMATGHKTVCHGWGDFPGKAVVALL